MSGRPRTTSFADGAKQSSSSSYGGMKTISEYSEFWSRVILGPSDHLLNCFDGFLTGWNDRSHVIHLISDFLFVKHLKFAVCIDMSITENDHSTHLLLSLFTYMKPADQFPVTFHFYVCMFKEFLYAPEHGHNPFLIEFMAKIVTLILVSVEKRELMELIRSFVSSLSKF